MQEADEYTTMPTSGCLSFEKDIGQQCWRPMQRRANSDSWRKFWSHWAAK